MALLLVQTLLQKKSSRTVQVLIAALEVMLLSAGLFFTLVVIKGALLPCSCDAVFSGLAGFWDSVRCLFSSTLYICLIINFTVLLILASSSASNFHHLDNDDDDDIAVSTFDHIHDDNVQISEACVITPPPPLREVYEVIPTDALPLPKPMFLHEARTSKSHETEKLEDLSSKQGPVVTPDEDNNDGEEMITMEATWKAITGEGKGSPEKKLLKKSETWDHHVPPAASVEVPSLSTRKWKELRKWETFDEAGSKGPRGGLVRRDPSMSLEEFNNQVETFIRTFNEDMRLQRQESEQRYFLEMINRGSA